MQKLMLSRWMSTNTWTRLPMCIRCVSIWKRLRTGTIRWPPSCRPNSMRNKLNAKRSRHNLRSWSVVLRRTRCIRAQARRSLPISSRERSRLNSRRTKRSTSSDSRTSPSETDLPTKRRYSRRRSSWQMVFIWLTSSSWRLRTRHWTRR